MISDFVRGSDRINLSALGLDFIGTQAFTAGAATGQLRYQFDSGAGAVTLLASTDADVTAEFAIQLTGVTALSAADLLL